jgi:predicted phosphate transport protein (TIGR00153 family)
MEEHACDDVVGRIIKALDRSFITPFDREDIHNLAAKLDDVLDNMEETAHRFEVFRLEKPPQQAVALARIIQECCLHLEHAVRACRALKHPKAIQDHLKEITRLENEADTIYRDADSGLFTNPPDILMLIKLREIYGWLEETVDACKDVAQIISEIVIKGS